MRETAAVDVPVKCARSGDVASAYQVIGDGPLDVVLVPDWVSNLAWAWHTPYWRNFYERLGLFAPVIVFDKRGTGLSDRPRFFPDMETRIDDLRAVLDAVGSEQAALVAAHGGVLEGIAICRDVPRANAQPRPLLPLDGALGSSSQRPLRGRPACGTSEVAADLAKRESRRAG